MANPVDGTMGHSSTRPRAEDVAMDKKAKTPKKPKQNKTGAGSKTK
jgi:hypothetical protein